MKKFNKIKDVNTIGFTNYEDYRDEKVKVGIGFAIIIGGVVYTISHWFGMDESIDMFESQNRKGHNSVQDVYDDLLNKSE